MADKPEEVATDTPQFGCHDLTPEPAGKQRKAPETEAAADAASQE